MSLLGVEVALILLLFLHLSSFQRMVYSKDLGSVNLGGCFGLRFFCPTSPEARLHQVPWLQVTVVRGTMDSKEHCEPLSSRLPETSSMPLPEGFPQSCSVTTTLHLAKHKRLLPLVPWTRTEEDCRL